jgi:hypothetical protein
MGVQNGCPKLVSQKFKKKFKKKLLEGREGGEGGELSFQCLRPSTSLMAAGKNPTVFTIVYYY